MDVPGKDLCLSALETMCRGQCRKLGARGRHQFGS